MTFKIRLRSIKSIDNNNKNFYNFRGCVSYSNIDIPLENEIVLNYIL